MDDKSKLVIELPWPPSVNHYWFRSGNRTFIGAKGVQFRKDVCFICSQISTKFDETVRLSISIEAYPPDKRKRDLDNIFKSLMDSLQHGGLFVDDNQIDSIFIKRMPSREGKVVVTLQSILN